MSAAPEEVFRDEFSVYLARVLFNARLEAIAREIEDLDWRVDRHVAAKRWTERLRLDPGDVPLVDTLIYDTDPSRRAEAAQRLCREITRRAQRQEMRFQPRWRRALLEASR